MKIIISPTKTMKRTKYSQRANVPIFLEKSLILRSILENYNTDKIKELFKISDKLAKDVYNYYQNPKKPIPAINLYEGLAFKNIGFSDFCEADFDYLDNHLYILSAMYGVLRPFDQIAEYRLDYQVKFEKDLYHYWQESIKDLLACEDIIINLASKEFSKSVIHPNIINIHLLDQKGRNLSTQAKIGRGNMIKYIAKNKIKEVEEIKKYKNLDYKFDEKKSDMYNFYFQKT